MKRLTFGLALVLFLAGIGGGTPGAQVIGVSGGYTYYPYREFSDEDAPADVELQVSSWRTTAAFPLAFNEGKTMFMNSVTCDVVDIEYRGPVAFQTVDRLHSVSLTVFFVQALSEKWQLVAVVTPGLASDFEGNLATDDVSFTAVLGDKYSFSDRFALGAGAAYERNFGEPLPLPFALAEWAISPRLALSALIPLEASLLYSPREFLDLGIFGETGGNRYHGDLDSWGVDNPLLKYSVASAGPILRIHFTPWAHLTIKGGYTSCVGSSSSTAATRPNRTI